MSTWELLPIRADLPIPKKSLVLAPRGGRAGGGFIMDNLKRLNVGECIIFPFETKTPSLHWTARKLDMRIAIRTVDEGVGVWRLS